MIRGGRRSGVVAAITVSFLYSLALTPMDARPLPVGRAWSPRETLLVNQHEYMVTLRMEPTRYGRIDLVTNGLRGPNGFQTYGYTFQDTAWVPRWSGIRDGFLPLPNITPPDREWLVWKYQDPNSSSEPVPLLHADVVDGALGQIDTIGMVHDEAFFSTSAATERREWAVAWERGPSRLFTRPIGAADWTSYVFDLNGEAGIACAPLDDTTLFVAGSHGSIYWGRATPSGFTPGGPPVGYPAFYLAPMRRDGRGGYWLIWGSVTRWIIAQHIEADGTWGDRDTLDGDYPPNSQTFTNVLSTSPDTAYRPLIAWMAVGYNYPGHYLYLAWPTDSGWTRGEIVPQSSGGGNCGLALDQNGDAWVVWNGLGRGNFWLHSYTNVTCSAPAVERPDGAPRLAWTLTGPAPRSWWTVLRSVEGAPADSIARVQAGDGIAMEFADTTAPVGTRLAYTIRREHVDHRYRWLSAATEWTYRLETPLRLSLRAAVPASDEVTLALEGAVAGVIELQLYDLQGRQVLAQRTESRGTGRDELRLGLARAGIRPGVYLLRARDGGGRRSGAVKLAVVR